VNKYGIDVDVAHVYARKLKAVHELGVQVAVVVGGGNSLRGVRRAQVTWIALLPTTLGCSDGDECGCTSGRIGRSESIRVLSAIDIHNSRSLLFDDVPFDTLKKARELSLRRRQSYFTTDSAAAREL
jgi:uridylate kinase